MIVHGLSDTVFHVKRDPLTIILQKTCLKLEMADMNGMNLVFLYFLFFIFPFRHHSLSFKINHKQ